MARKWVGRLMSYYVRTLQPIPDQFPEPATEAWSEVEQIWDEGLASENAQDAECFAAIRRIAREVDRPKFWADHLPGLLEAVRKARADNYAQGEGGSMLTAGSRDEALAGSKGCEYCGGNGMVSLFHPDCDGSQVVRTVDAERGERRVAGIVMGHCVCKMGRWLRSQSKDKAILPRIPDLGPILDGTSRTLWLLDNPAWEGLDLPRYRRTVPEMAGRIGTNLGKSRGNPGEKSRDSPF